MADNGDNIVKLPNWDESPTLAETGKEKLDLSANWLDYTQVYPEPRYLLEYCGVPFAPLGGIQAITGQKKNGKTFLMCQFMAAILSNNSENMRAQLPGLCIHESTKESLGKEPSVLYVDTEMEKLNTVKVVRRVQYLCNWNYTVDNPLLRVLWLRAEQKNSVRWEKIKQAIMEIRPTAIFLDGIRDVIGDFNDNEESANLIAECMSIATNLNCCIFSVLHENPGSEKMRGHLGTELGNKVTDTFSTSKDKKDNTVEFTVKQIDARGKDVPDWKFEIVDDAGSLGVPRIISTVVVDKGDDIEQIKKWLTEGQNDIEWPAFGKEIRMIFKNRGNVTNNDTLQADFDKARNRRLIIEQKKKDFEKGQVYPKYYLNENEILPF